MSMATKSMLKNVDIKDKKLGRALVSALEQASKKQAKDVVLSRTYEDIRSDRIVELFGKNK